jgi:hypothetical protein
VTPIYHFTHKANLPKILGMGCLVCDRLCKEEDLTARDIAFSDLKLKRAETVVEVAPGGTLADYVPFYFGTRSPMLFVYHKGGVTGKPESQNDLVYFVAYVEDIVQSGFAYAFTDGHPIREPKAFYNDITQLTNVDLPLMTQQMWTDTNEDPDRKRRRQAEFLVYERVPLEIFRGVATRTEAMRTEVREMLAHNSIHMRCAVRSDWYYN